MASDFWAAVDRDSLHNAIEPLTQSKETTALPIAEGLLFVIQLDDGKGITVV